MRTVTLWVAHIKYNMDEVLDVLIAFFDKNFFESDAELVGHAGAITKYKLEATINEGEEIANGETMIFNLFIDLRMTFRNDEPTFFMCEFIDQNSGQIMNYIYQPDYFLFMVELESCIKSKGLPF